MVSFFMTKDLSVRKKYLDFFREAPRSHQVIPSSSLVPENDPTTLFTGSGMQPLIPYLLGQEHPLGDRLVNSQKCFRAQDIEEVGDNRHTTFFEMLGNWSLGDYFKEKQLKWFFQFLTEKIQLAPERLYVTVFAGNQQIPKDTESIEIWQKLFLKKGIKAKINERIFPYSEEKNWWSRSGPPDQMPPGEPGGPDSEVFYDFGKERKIHETSPYANRNCHPNCDCGRFLEIGNSVFMQYVKTENGFQELPKKNVDFGGGLERMIAACENNPDIFTTSSFLPIIEEIQKITNKSYHDAKNIEAMRIIADHIKAVVFLISDNVYPANKAQGYILRRLLRRAGVKMHHLRDGLTPISGFSMIAEEVMRMYDGVYLDRSAIREKVSRIIDEEMDKFAKSLDRGLKIIEQKENIDGKTAFDLYQCYGFPLEITKELLTAKGIKINEEEFKREFEKHQQVSRSSSKGMFKGGLADQSIPVTKLHTATHLLQQALKTVLKKDIRQAGSHITAKRLRFDFTYSEKITAGQQQDIQNLVNEQIKKNLAVKMKTLPFDQAQKEGAAIVPGTKYPEKVKVYSIGDFSKEVCGGPHIDFTGDLGSFKIIKEEGLSSGIRRIYAILE